MTGRRPTSPCRLAPRYSSTHQRNTSRPCFGQFRSWDTRPISRGSAERPPAEKAQKILEDIAEKVDPTSRSDLLNVANTSMVTKLVTEDAPHLARVVVDAITLITEKGEKGLKADIDNVKVEKKPGGSISDTQLISGMVLDKEVVHSGMPKRIAEAKIALVNSALEIEKTEFSAEIRINDPAQMQQFMDEESNILKGMVEKIKDAGANVVICQKGIDDLAQHFLAKAGVLTVRRVKESDMTKLAKATGARMVTNLDDLTSKDLGYAKLVEERKLEDDKWVFIEGCKNPKAVTILVRGGTQRIVDEAERALHDALDGDQGRGGAACDSRRRRSPRGRGLAPAQDMGAEALRKRAAGCPKVRRCDGVDTHDACRKRRHGPHRHTSRSQGETRERREVVRGRRDEREGRGHVRKVNRRTPSCQAPNPPGGHRGGVYDPEDR